MFLHIVKCPHCDYEYSASEVLVQSCLLEKPYFIKRNTAGKIEGALGREGSLQDTYQCDFCNKRFEVVADITFETKKVDSFNTVSTVKFK